MDRARDIVDRYPVLLLRIVEYLVMSEWIMVVLYKDLPRPLVRPCQEIGLRLKTTTVSACRKGQRDATYA